jgi:hypothetical protein
LELILAQVGARLGWPGLGQLGKAFVGLLSSYFSNFFWIEAFLPNMVDLTTPLGVGFDPRLVLVVVPHADLDGAPATPSSGCWFCNASIVDVVLFSPPIFLF